MKLTAKLALCQIKMNRNRSVMTQFGIILSSAMLTAVFGFAASAKATIDNAFGYDYNNDSYNATIIAMGAVLGVIIITASVIVVSNAFRISAGERIKQFGILKSTGATKKQITASVLYEGVFLSLVGIPVGIAVGLIIDLIGTSAITRMLHSLSEGGTLHVDSEALLTIPFTAPPLMFIITIVTSFGTVMLSAWIPAYKAAKIPAIEAIRNTGEVKLKSKNIRTSKLFERVFGFEGVLALKSLKRSRNNSRATVVSLTISIVLLITAGSFGTMMNHSTNLMLTNIDATVEVDWISEINMSIDNEGERADISYIQLDGITAETITGMFRNYNNSEVFGIGYNRNYKANLPDGTKTVATLMSIDKMYYEELCKTANVPIGSNLLINLHRKSTGGKIKEYTPYDFSKIKDQPITFTHKSHETVEIIITGELSRRDISGEISHFIYGSDMIVIVPDIKSMTYNWYVNENDVSGFIKYAEQVLIDVAPQSTDEINISSAVFDIADATNQIRYLVDTFMFFVYGFVGMLTLIGVTSVISTINTNIRSRTKEFAVLESIGMTKSGIRKMLNIESILCFIKSLIYGIPLGTIGAYVLYLGMKISVELSFEFPLLLIIECTLGVFAITWITMRYAASRLKNGSIIETIRGE